MRANHLPPVMAFSQTAHCTYSTSRLLASNLGMDLFLFFYFSESSALNTQPLLVSLDCLLPKAHHFLFSAGSRAGGNPGLYFFSMPLVNPLPGLVAQQKTESSPHFAQTCFTSSLAPSLPPPATLM